MSSLTHISNKSFIVPSITKSPGIPLDEKEDYVDDVALLDENGAKDLIASTLSQQNVNKKILEQEEEMKEDEELNKTKIKQRCKAAVVEFYDPKKNSALKTLHGNFSKKTYCYKLITDDGAKYFVKIYEDPQMAPTFMAKKLFTNTELKKKLSHYLLIPAFKPLKTPHGQHNYEIVIYPYLSHITLEELTLKAWQEKYINPSYFLPTNKCKQPHSLFYRKKMLQVMAKTVTIAIELKNAGYVDMDISPDNFIIKCDKDDCSKNNDISWKDITDADKCIKIDHEAVLKWKEKYKTVNKPMKTPFTAPEVNQNDEEFEVEKANVYQFGATYIYVLYGQLKGHNDDGTQHWKYACSRGWKKSSWTPKLCDLKFLRNCVTINPQQRPTYDHLLKDVKHELAKYEKPKKSQNFGSSNNLRRKNNLNNFNNRNNRNNGNKRQMGIIFNQQHKQSVSPSSSSVLSRQHQSRMNNQNRVNQQNHLLQQHGRPFNNNRQQPIMQNGQINMNNMNPTHRIQQRNTLNNNGNMKALQRRRYLQQQQQQRLPAYSNNLRRAGNNTLGVRCGRCHQSFPNQDTFRIHQCRTRISTQKRNSFQ